MNSKLDFFVFLSNNLQAYMDEHYRQPQYVAVEPSRMELSKLATEQRYFFRIGLYDNGNAVNANIPGLNVRGVRVDTGYPVNTIQQVGVQCSVTVPNANDTGEFTELDLVEITDHIEQWGANLSGSIYTLTDGYCPFFVYGNTSRVSRPIDNVSLVDVTMLCQRKTPLPHDQS